MPPKRKAPSQIPDEDDQISSRPQKKQQTTKQSSTSSSQQQEAPADFGSAFAALLSAPVPKPVTPVATTTTTSTKQQPIDTKSFSKNGDKKNNTKDTKESSSKDKPKYDKKGRRIPDDKDSKERTASAVFLAAKEDSRRKRQPQAAVVTISREESTKQQLANQFSKLQKQREMEKSLLFEKDHIKPQYDDTEKQLVRIATKGVVALFQAVYDQSQKLKEIQRSTSLSSSSRDKIINEEAQGGFLDLLKQATEKTASADAVYVAGNRRKFTDLKSKLENDREINWDDLEGLGLSEDDEQEIKNERKSVTVAKNMTKNGLGSKNRIEDHSDDSDDDDGEVVPKFRRQALERQRAEKDARIKEKQSGITKKGNKPVAGSKWNVLDDDYVQSKASNKMKDWEKDNTSDSDL